MARKVKQVIAETGLDRRVLGYYSTPPAIAEYLFKRCREINPQGNTVIDPCVGQEELLQPFITHGMACVGIDVIQHQTHYTCDFLHDDFISLYMQREQVQTSTLFKQAQQCHYWIANPPYNCHELDYIQSNKASLKRSFADVGVHNMYAMFISAIIDLAAPGAVIGIITHDSFLTAKAHKALRQKLFAQVKIHDLLLCPTSLFSRQGADVRTCIMIMEKTHQRTGNVRLLNRPATQDAFYTALAQENFIQTPLADMVLSAPVDNQELLIDVPSAIRDLFQHPRLGQCYACISGISTGNDKRYLCKEKRPGFSIPFYKNPGSRKFFTKEDGYLLDSFQQESKRIGNFIVRNSSFLFMEGITCSSMGVEFSACYLPANSTFGVNPTVICPPEDIWWLLAYLNSHLVKFFIRGVLNRSNMVTSGYVARVPLVRLSESDKSQLSQHAKSLYKRAQQGISISTTCLFHINDIIYTASRLSSQDRTQVEQFCQDIVKRT